MAGKIAHVKTNFEVPLAASESGIESRGDAINHENWLAAVISTRLVNLLKALHFLGCFVTFELYISVLLYFAYLKERNEDLYL